MNHNKIENWDFVVIGGGAAGYFAAIVCAEAYSNAKVLILEATSRTLTKVKISGGGRCNVTHNQFDPRQLVLSYPRGKKELLGPFHTFQPKDTVNWFAKHGVELVAESDGRMFPKTNNSETIIDCFQSAADKAGIVLKKNMLVQDIIPTEDGYKIYVKSFPEIAAKNVLLATGSMPFGIKLAQKLGHEVISPVPSLFTFEIQDPLLHELPGVSFERVQIKLQINEPKKEFLQEGPCLITHWGLSGPAILKLSAFAARELYDQKYHADLLVNWVFPLKKENIIEKLTNLKQSFPKRQISNMNHFACVQRFWIRVLKESGISPEATLAELAKKQFDKIAEILTHTKLSVIGKGVFKEEFVTAGGVSRKEIDFRTMESKRCPGIYFSGEVLDIDGITGGFNFQNAWTGAWIAGHHVANKLKSEN